MEEIEPRSFSFNNPFGACPSCAGLGYKMEFDEDLMIPDKTVSIADGAITVLGWQSCTIFHFPPRFVNIRKKSTIS